MGQLSDKLLENHIYSVFAVEKQQYQWYEVMSPTHVHTSVYRSAHICGWENKYFRPRCSSEDRDRTPALHSLYYSLGSIVALEFDRNLLWSHFRTTRLFLLLPFLGVGTPVTRRLPGKVGPLPGPKSH